MLVTLDKPIILPNNEFTYKNVEIHIRHSHGGINYANYQQEQSGYYLHFCPCNFRKEKDYSVREYGPMFNDYSYKVRIGSGYRISKKKLAQLQELFNTIKDEVLELYTTNEKLELFAFLTTKFHKFLEE